MFLFDFQACTETGTETTNKFAVDRRECDLLHLLVPPQHPQHGDGHLWTPPGGRHTRGSKPWFKLRKMVFDWNRLVLSTTLWPTTGVGRNFKEFIHFRPKYKCTLSSHLIFRCFGANLLKNYFRTRCFSLSLAATSLPPARSAQTQSCKIFLFSFSFDFGFDMKHWNMTLPAKNQIPAVPTYYERNFSLLNVIIGCHHWHERFSQTCTPVNQSCRNIWFGR